MRARVLALASLLPILVLGPALAEELGAEDRAAVFAAAGFVPRADQYVRCDDTVTASAMPGFIELADLNGDGRPEAWVRESSLFCYGDTAEAFVLLTRDADGTWIKLLDQIGVALPLEAHHDGWPDIEVGGPGSGPFPVYRFDGTSYVHAN